MRPILMDPTTTTRPRSRLPVALSMATGITRCLVLASAAWSYPDESPDR